jgi:heme-degrading monooxygenase HmoA
MYIDRQDFIAELGSDPTILDNAIASLAKPGPAPRGLLGQTLLRSYAYPTKYTLVRRWDDIASAWASDGRDPGGDFASRLPAELYRRTRFEGFETVIDVASDKLGADQAKVVQLADWELSSIARAAAYEASRGELFALQKEHVEGFVSAQLQRSAGVPTKYVMVIQFTSREATGGGGRIPQIRDFVTANPSPNFANSPPAIEFHAVVQRA